MTECYSSERQISLKFRLNVSQPQTDRLRRFRLHIRAFSFFLQIYAKKKIKYTESLAALSVLHTHVQFKDVKAVKCS